MDDQIITNREKKAFDRQMKYFNKPILIFERNEAIDFVLEIHQILQHLYQTTLNGIPVNFKRKFEGYYMENYISFTIQDFFEMVCLVNVALDLFEKYHLEKLEHLGPLLSKLSERYNSLFDSSILVNDKVISSTQLYNIDKLIAITNS